MGRIRNDVSTHRMQIDVRFNDVLTTGTGKDLIYELGDLARRSDTEEEQWRL